MYSALVYLTIFAVSTCGLVYQLLAGSVASYILGDSVTHFSVVIGIFLSSLGLGAWLAKYLSSAPARAFIDASLSAAVVGGATTLLLFMAWSRTRFFQPTLYALIVLNGALVGLELPLLLRVLRRQMRASTLLARALAVDYLGAVVGSLAFALLIVPRLGYVRSGLVFGALNAIAALGATWILGPAVGAAGSLRAKAAMVIVALSALFVFSGRLAIVAEDGMYPDPVVLARQTPYQRVVFTSGRGSLQLFLDGNLQFASVDEHRYHEALVHPAFAAARAHERVLVLGGGDGLAVREILRHGSVRTVTVVDLDDQMTSLARSFGPLTRLNRGSLNDRRVRVVNDDAMVWIGRSGDAFDVVVVDFPDPNNFSLGKLYTSRFYQLLAARLAPGAVIVVQATSPLQARQSYWCVVRSIEAAGLRTLPYHAPVPSFGEWGFVLASRETLSIPRGAPTGLRYLDDAVMATLFVFPRDMARVPAEINRLNNQILVHYYDREWRRGAY